MTQKHARRGHNASRAASGLLNILTLSDAASSRVQRGQTKHIADIGAVGGLPHMQQRLRRMLFYHYATDLLIPRCKNGELRSVYHDLPGNADGAS